MKKFMATVVSVMVLFAFFGVMKTEAAINIGGKKIVINPGSKGDTKPTEKQPDVQSTKEQQPGREVRKDWEMHTFNEAQDHPNYIHVEKRYFYLADSLKYTSEAPLTLIVVAANYPHDYQSHQVGIFYNDWEIKYVPGGSKLKVMVRSLRREEYINGKLTAIIGKGDESQRRLGNSVATMAGQLYEQKTGKSAAAMLEGYEDF